MIEAVTSTAERRPVGPLQAQDRRLIRLRACLEEGLPLVPEPFKVLAEQTGLSVEEVRTWIGHWQHSGFIKRFGLVVRHRRLGLAANAMVVWNLPEDRVDEVGRRLAAEPEVTLCYASPRLALQPVLHDPRRPASACRGPDPCADPAPWPRRRRPPGAVQPPGLSPARRTLHARGTMTPPEEP